MPAQSIFRWPEGRGWLVFSGGADEDVRALALGRAAADGAVACVILYGDTNADQLLDDLTDLGAPSGYLVDVNAEDDQTLQDKLGQAGVVVIAGGSSPADVRGELFGAALEGIQTAYQNGAILLLEGYSATAFGAWLLDEAGEEVQGGLDWLSGAVVLTGVDQAAPHARPIFQGQPSAIAVAIMPGSALAFGPDGQVERWGEQAITVALGPAFGK